MIRTRLRATLRVVFCLVIGLGVSASPAVAGPILFDTFGPGDTFGAGAYGVDGNAEFQAFRFIPTATGVLEQITVALGRTSDVQTTTTFNLYEDAGGVNLGALIESFAVPNTATPAAFPDPLIGAVVTFASGAAPTLTGGVAYWLSFTEADVMNGARSGWFFNTIGVNGTRLTNALPANAGLLPAFRVEARAIPEPATSALVLVGGRRSPSRTSQPDGLSLQPRQAQRVVEDARDLGDQRIRRLLALDAARHHHEHEGTAP